MEISLYTFANATLLYTNNFGIGISIISDRTRGVTRIELREKKWFFKWKTIMVDRAVFFVNQHRINHDLPGGFRISPKKKYKVKVITETDSFYSNTAYGREIIAGINRVI